VPEAIQVQGYAEFRRGLLKIDKEWSATEGLKRVGDRAAGLVVDWAKPRVPRRTGKTAGSVKATSTATAAKVTGGGARVPWYPWIDFGGTVGRKRSVHRAFLPDGRFIYPGFAARRDEITDVIAEEMRRMITGLGWDVTSG
jgi:hypothetical protein